MSETGQETTPNPDPYGIDGYLEDIGVWSEGHKDKDGNPRVELMDDEIRNEVNSVTSRVRTLILYKKAPENVVDQYVQNAVSKLHTVFPENKREIMKDFARENKDETVQNYLHYFEESKEDKT